MAGKNTAVFGIFPSRTRAEQALTELINAGFRSSDISILAPDQRTTKELATEKNTKAPEGTTTGATAGGAIGGTLGLLAGIGAGIGALPRPRAVRCRSDDGGTCGSGSRRCGRRSDWRSRRDGNPEV